MTARAGGRHSSLQVREEEVRERRSEAGGETGKRKGEQRLLKKGDFLASFGTTENQLPSAFFLKAQLCCFQGGHFHIFVLILTPWPEGKCRPIAAFFFFFFGLVNESNRAKLRGWDDTNYGWLLLAG